MGNFVHRLRQSPRCLKWVRTSRGGEYHPNRGPSWSRTSAPRGGKSDRKAGGVPITATARDVYFGAMPISTAPVLEEFLSPVPEAALAPTLPAQLRWPVSILGVPLDPVTIDEALARIADMVASGVPHYV